MKNSKSLDNPCIVDSSKGKDTKINIAPSANNSTNLVYYLLLFRKKRIKDISKNTALSIEQVCESLKELRTIGLLKVTGTNKCNKTGVTSFFYSTKLRKEGKDE